MVAPIWNNFNAGELGPNMDGRTDQEKYYAGCRTLRNFLPLVQGPAMRRGGTRFIGQTKAGKAWLVPFIYSVDQAYAIELGGGYARFWTNRGRLLSSPDGPPYEIVSPFALTDLVTAENTKAIRYAQSEDILWLVSANGTKRPQKLIRSGATSWAFAPVEFQYGPFQDVDPTSTIRVSISAQFGSGISAYASAPIFKPEHVGTYMYLEVFDPGANAPWEPGKPASVTMIKKYQGNVYIAVAGPDGVLNSGSWTSGTTGSVPPTHLRGAWSDGGVTWKYLHSGYGIVKITAVAPDGLSATVNASPARPGLEANVCHQFVNAGGVGSFISGADSNATTRWAFSAYNDVLGWPNDVGFFRNRLIYVGPGALTCASQIGDPDNFGLRDGPSVTAQTALVLPVRLAKLDRVRWIAELSALVLGGSMLEAAVAEQTPQQVFSATNVKAESQTDYGARFVSPVRMGDAVLFVERGGEKLREFKYDFSMNKHRADDLTKLASHILKSGVVTMAFSQVPDTGLRCVLEDGTVALLTYNREATVNVVGWSPLRIGGNDTTSGKSYGFVQDVISIPSPNQRRDDPWYLVRRTIDGVPVTYVEVEEDPRLHEIDRKAAFFVDAGISYEGAPTSAIGGLGHLEGQTVQVLADGAVHAPVVVTGGVIQLQWAASVAHIGLASEAVLETMRMELGGKEDSTQTKLKSVTDIWLRLEKSFGGKAGTLLSNVAPIAYPDYDLPIGTLRPLHDGDVLVPSMSGWEQDARIVIVQDEPLPMTIKAIIPRVEGEQLA